MTMGPGWMRRMATALLVAATCAPMAVTANAQVDDRPGLIDDGEYESPQFGTGITWTDAWEVGDPDDEYVAHAIGGYWDDSVGSDPSLGDALFLIDTATESAVLSLGMGENGAITAADYRSIMATDQFITDNLFLQRGAEVLLLDDDGDEYVAILARDPAPDTEHAIYVEIRVPEDLDEPIISVGIDLFDADSYEESLDSLADDLEIDDFDIFTVFSEDEVLDALDAPVTEGDDGDGTEDVTPTAESGDTTRGTADDKKLPDDDDVIATPDDDDATATPEDDDTSQPGVIGEGEYESPQYGDTVTWGESWAISESYDDPVVSDEDSGLDSLLFTDTATENAILYVTFEDLPFDEDDLLDMFEGDTYLENILGLEDGEILLSDTSRGATAMLVRGTYEGVETVVFLLARETDDPDVTSFIDLRAYATDFDEDLLTALDEDFEVNGDSGLDVFSIDDILDALDA